MRALARVLGLIALTLIASACDGEFFSDPPPEQGVVTIDHVQFAGHGALFDTNGDYIAVDLALAGQLQASLLSALLEDGAPENAERIRMILAEARRAQLTRTDHFVLRDMLIAWRLTIVPITLRGQYQTRAITLHQIIETLLLLSMRSYFIANPTLADLVGVRIVPFHERIFLHPDLTQTNYEDRCRELGVPVPPPLTDPAWALLGTQTPLHLPSFLARVRVFGGERPVETCIALERLQLSSSDGQIFTGQVGVICQNAENGQACFWDGIGEAKLSAEMTEFADGDVAADNCTNCHRGQNAFLVVPGSPLDVSATHTIASQVWYQPVSVQPGWVNPAPVVEDGLCGNCHDLPGVFREGNPDLGSDYCAILRWAASDYMPSAAAPAGQASLWANHPTLDAACNS